MRIQATLGDRAGLGALKSALNAYALRHRLASSNIANAETPGYRAQRVEFEDIAKRALDNTSTIRPATTDPRHMAATPAKGKIEPQVVDANADESAGGAVDLEREIVSMVENQLAYRLAVRMLDMKYRQLHAAINGQPR